MRRALSHGRTILATASGGLGELMADSASGIPILKPDKDAVVAAIADAFACGARGLKEMGAAGKRYMENARSWERVAQMTAEVYRRLPAPRPRESVVHFSKQAPWLRRNP